MMPANGGAVLGFGAFRFDPHSHVLYRGAEPVRLGGRAADVLAVLIQHAGSVVPACDIMDAVWPDLFVEENNLHVQISTLRKALGHDAIQNVARRGYRLTASVEALLSERLVADQCPPPPVQLIGRDEDLDGLAKIVTGCSLVTLVGPGGIGKTALAGALARNFRDAPVIWTDLSASTDLSGVLVQVSSSAGLSASSAESLTRLVGSLATDPFLLVLDNAEQVTGPVALLCEELQTRRSSAKCLVTSQLRLNAAGEHVYRLGGLSFGSEPIDDLAEQPALRLFLDRAQAADQRFAISLQNRGAIAELCRRLEGNPLAIELAANRSAVLGASQALKEIDERVGALSTRSPRKPERQRSLEAMLEWSLALLTDEQRAMFDKLAVWHMTFDIRTAEELLDCADAASIVGILIEHSLVSRSSDEPPFFRINDVARTYSMQCLRDRSDYEPLRRAIAVHRQKGRAALQNGLEHEAIQHLSAALHLASLSEGQGSQSAELEILLELGPALQTAFSPASERCRDTYRRAVVIADRLGSDGQRFEARWGLWHYLSMVGEEQEASASASELRQIAAGSDDVSLHIESLHASLTTKQLTGCASGVVADAALLRQLYESETHHPLAFRFGGHDPAVCALSQSAVALWLTGREEEAAEAMDESLRLADRLDHAHSTAVACFYGAIAAHCLGDVPRFGQLADRLLKLSRLRGMEALEVEARLLAGRARFDQASSPEALCQMIEAYDELISSGERAFIPLYACLCAEALIKTGDKAVAKDKLHLADAAIAAGQSLFVPEVLRLKALASRDRRAADALVQRGLELAGTQGAIALQKRLRVRHR